MQNREGKRHVLRGYFIRDNITKKLYANVNMEMSSKYLLQTLIQSRNCNAAANHITFYQWNEEMK